MNGNTRVSHWAQIEEATFVAGMWLLYRIHRWLGRYPFLLFLYPVVLYYWATRSLARRSSRQYLERLQQHCGAFDGAPTWRHELRHFLCFADTILDKLLAWSGRYRFERVHYQGLEPVQQLILEQRGAVFVVGHVGCLELCQAVAERQPGMKLTVLVHTRHAQRFNRLLQRLNPGASVRLLQVTEVSAATAVDLAHRVQRGEFVAIAGDRVPVTDSKTASADFLGHPARFPVGAYVIAALLKCPLYFLACVHRDDGYLIRFDRWSDRLELPRQQRDLVLQQCAQGFARWLENLLRESPYDWFNFFPFWDQS